MSESEVSSTQDRGRAPMVSDSLSVLRGQISFAPAPFVGGPMWPALAFLMPFQPPPTMSENIRFNFVQNLFPISNSAGAIPVV
eukprot:g21836.t1